MRIEGNALVSSTPAVVLREFVFRMSFGDLLFSRFTVDIARSRSPRAALSLPSASRTLVRSAGIDCARGL